jgi:DNA repair protein RadA/Sms
LRSLKNRYGSNAELAFTKASGGLREGEIFEMLFARITRTERVAIDSAIEGIAFSYENTGFGSQLLRNETSGQVKGFDLVDCYVARHARKARRFQAAQKDVFLNIAGGLRVKIPH